jgi:hypothetical protein
VRAATVAALVIVHNHFIESQTEFNFSSKFLPGIRMSISKLAKCSMPNTNMIPEQELHTISKFKRMDHL